MAHAKREHKEKLILLVPHFVVVVLLVSDQAAGVLALDVGLGDADVAHGLHGLAALVLDPGHVGPVQRLLPRLGPLHAEPRATTRLELRNSIHGMTA